MASYDLKSWVQTKYPHLSESDAEFIANKAKMFYYNIKYAAYPQADETSNPITNTRDIWWVQAACSEMVDKYGIGNVVAYSENGLSVQYDSAELSLSLVKLLTPIAGVL